MRRREAPHLSGAIPVREGRDGRDRIPGLVSGQGWGEGHGAWDMIHIAGLQKRFGRRTVLDGVDLTLSAGHRVALVGSNGAGKTTLIRCLLGEYQATGTIRVEGLDPRRERVRVLQRVGFVPQLPPPLKLPVGHLVQLAARLARVEEERIHEVARTLGLDLREHRRQIFAKLSGGMKQKALIAIALGRRPRLLIMDEPAANLDPEARKAFFALLDQFPPETLMLLSSHRVDEIAGLVNRVVEMDQGRVTRNQGVGGESAAGALLSCRVRLVRAEPGVVRELEHWGFSGDHDQLHWYGRLAAPDRLRFLGTLSRFAELTDELHWHHPDTHGKDGTA